MADIITRSTQDIVIPGIEKFEFLPNGKRHISFSELRGWIECAYRHKLQHIDKIDLSKPGIALDFGTSCHASHEQFIKTGVMDVDVALDMLRVLWEKHEHVDMTLEEAQKQATACLVEVPIFYDAMFPGWKPVCAEQLLYEPIGGERPHAFKGFIDAVISAPKGKKEIFWIVDVKTTGWGWDKKKKSDPLIRAQLMLYKHYWCQKTGTDPKLVRCAFLLLKRVAKPGVHCQLLPVSVGEVTTQRALKLVANMLWSMKKGVFVKNHCSCLYCDYKTTDMCEQWGESKAKQSQQRVKLT